MSALGKNIIDELLAAMFSKPNTGGAHSFFFGKPGAPFHEQRMGTEVHYNAAALTVCALNYRQNGPSYLRYLPISEVKSLLMGFVSDYYGILADETFLSRIEGSYADHVSEGVKARFAAALMQSRLFHPPQSTMLFPLVPVIVKADFDSASFFFCDAAGLNETRLNAPLRAPYLISAQYPPIADWKGRKEIVSSWLGVRSPDVRAARKVRAAILGALALTPYKRHMFSGRKMFGGIGQIKPGDGVSFSFEEQHTPAMMYDIELTKADHDWLTILETLLSANDDQSKRYVRALEYFYRAWPKPEVERFPLMFMTLDAVFGERNNAAQAVIDGIRTLLGTHIEEKRLRELMDMRASVIHGGSPDIYDSSKYPKYYRRYDADPITDLEVVVAECLRQRVFGGALRVHENPNKDLLEKLQAEGKISRNRSIKTILDAQAGEPSS